MYGKEWIFISNKWGYAYWEHQQEKANIQNWVWRILFLSDSELDLGDENNDDSTTDARKTKVKLKNGPIKWLLCERRNL